jgi:hypothetical protein
MRRNDGYTMFGWAARIKIVESGRPAFHRSAGSATPARRLGRSGETVSHRHFALCRSGF